jgi:ubiquinone/menaquinone biosynthesis C-methylase UbiE
MAGTGITDRLTRRLDDGRPVRLLRMRDLRQARYAAAQGARVAWYAAHYALARRFSQPFDRPGEPPFRPQSPPGDPKRIRAAFLKLFADDAANIADGLYPAPRDFSLRQAREGLENSIRFLMDLPRVDRRRVERKGVEIRADAARPDGLPPYYLQNFHYQSGGWLTDESAKLYDTQVEVLFAGAADAMRRIALGALARALRGRDQRRTRLLDVACGNGRFLSQILGAFPRLDAVGLDLSPAYASAARTRLAPWPQADVVVGPAEAMPFPDGAFDAVTSIYLFHELPPRVRRDVARDIARVVAPGGVFLLADSLQMNDAPDLNQMLESFPVGFHEPFFSSYQSEDLVSLFGETGLRLEHVELAFLTKVMRFRRT